eukprot:CAMPEP_0184288594 /NCGR_PEP_ID=MMETSP1049-20130417/1100_1 /TAXON_ID=77928 /ORGANISM="Proteomonas sulcata, Strain CCMP704" /LENGTH=367 /DNA_ID=CAMNT_0026595069 /DNA_START=559 /DNA_END=1662 /DNA_ORIENTATION=-
MISVAVLAISTLTLFGQKQSVSMLPGRSGIGMGPSVTRQSKRTATGITQLKQSTSTSSAHMVQSRKDRTSEIHLALPAKIDLPVLEPSFESNASEGQLSRGHLQGGASSGSLVLPGRKTPRSENSQVWESTPKPGINRRAGHDHSKSSDLRPCELGILDGVGSCTVHSRVYTCTTVDGVLNFRKEDPPPLPSCLGGKESFGACVDGQFLCDNTDHLNTLDLEIGIISIPRQQSILNQTLNSLVHALGSFGLNTGDRDGRKPRVVVNVLNVRPVHSDFQAVKQWWEGRTDNVGINTHFFSVTVPSIHDMSTDVHTAKLSPLVKEKISRQRKESEPVFKGSVMQQTVTRAEGSESEIDHQALNLQLNSG